MCYIMDNLRVNSVTCVFSLPPLSTLSPSSFLYRLSDSRFVSCTLLLLLSLLALLWRSFPLPLRLFMLLLLLLFPLLPLLPLSLFILFLIILGHRFFLLFRGLRLLLLRLVFLLFLLDFLLFTLPRLLLLLLSSLLFLFLSLPPGAVISLLTSLLCFPLLFSFLFRSFRLFFFSHASSSLVYTSFQAHVLIILDQYLSRALVSCGCWLGSLLSLSSLPLLAAVVTPDISAGSSVLLYTLRSSSSLLSDRPASSLTSSSSSSSSSSFLSASVATTLASSSSFLLPLGFAVAPDAPVSSAPLLPSFFLGSASLVAPSLPFAAQSLTYFYLCLLVS